MEVALPELPEMQALAERIEAIVAGSVLERADVLGFSALKTVRPAPSELVGKSLLHVARRAKYLVFSFAGGDRLLVHLSQAGRLDFEQPPKSTRPKGALGRLCFSGGKALLVREHGTERKAGWWILAKGADGPLATLGPDVDTAEATAVLKNLKDKRRLHTVLRDQHVVAGLGRGYTDDVLNRARLSPFASPAALRDEERERLVDAVEGVIDKALKSERQRKGGLSDPRLGERFLVHGRAGKPCPNCGRCLERVSFESYEIAYCPKCQTRGKVLADRRLSRLLR